MSRPLYALILAGGEGKRMKSAVPKVLIDLLGRPLLGHVLDALVPLRPKKRVIIGGRHLSAMREAFASEEGVAFARQPLPRGTAHAVKCALPHLPKTGADVLIVNGDVPLIRPESLGELLRIHRRTRADLSLVTAHVEDPTGLGRILRDSRGRFVRIVEERDASPEERLLREINSGQYLVRVEALHRWLPKIRNRNSQREFYLTDLVTLVGERKHAFPLQDADEARGINRPEELVAVRRLLKARIFQSLAEGGVHVVDPDLTYVEVGVQVGFGTTLLPFVVLRRGVSIAAHCVVGPLTHVRGETTLGEGAMLGNFVEAKSALIGARSKALHLTYLGDARVGVGANIGAGTITANFDGQRHHVTTVGDEASIGAGTLFVAPVKVGHRARTGAGAVVLAGRNVPDGATVVGIPAAALKGLPQGPVSRELRERSRPKAQKKNTRRPAS